MRADDDIAWALFLMFLKESLSMPTPEATCEAARHAASVLKQLGISSSDDMYPGWLASKITKLGLENGGGK